MIGNYNIGSEKRQSLSVCHTDLLTLFRIEGEEFFPYFWMED